MENITFSALFYDDDNVLRDTYDSENKAINFAKNCGWDEVVRDDTGEVIWKNTLADEKVKYAIELLLKTNIGDLLA
jgi:hypothetical protein